jgi:hypothetical protein
MTCTDESRLRAELITGLLDLAVFLESHPDVPAPHWADLLVFPADGTEALLVLGIRRGDRGKRLTGEPGSGAEVLARRMLTGSRGCASRDNAKDSQ